MFNNKESDMAHTDKDAESPYEQRFIEVQVTKRRAARKLVKNRGLAKRARMMIGGNDPVTRLQAVHNPRCACISCAIARGNRENEARISAWNGYSRPNRYYF